MAGKAVRLALNQAQAAAQSAMMSSAGQQVSGSASIPAPAGGWNTVTPKAQMSPDDAVQLDNFEPGFGAVRSRLGYRIHTTGGMGGQNVDTLAVWSGAAGGAVLVAATNGSLYDCSTFNTTGTLLATGYSSDQWQCVVARQRLLMYNGVDTPQQFDGATVSDATYTGSGLDPTKLITVNLFKSRLFIVERDSLAYWYGSTNTITGALVKFDLESLFPLGGYLMAIGTWTRDAGDGVDDLCVFLSSEGEILLYQGNDPGDATAWSMVGRFRTGRPIGRRCFLTLGTDLVILSQDGLTPLSRIITLGRVDNGGTSISQKISPTFSSSAQAYGSLFGWQPILYPLGNKVFVNVPAGSPSQQYVVNTLTGAWARYLGMDARCWVLFNDQPYWGSTDGRVMQAEYGLSDGSTSNAQTNGTAITATLKGSFQYYGGRGIKKQFYMIRPLLNTSGLVTLQLALLTDYQTSAVLPAAVTPEVPSSAWDTSPWDTTPWGDAPLLAQAWYGVSAIGYTAAIYMQTTTSQQRVEMNSIDLLFQGGNIV